MKRKILVVDSELNICMILSNFLGNDFDVVAVENGYEAISWLQHGNHADLLLFDTHLSMINGYEFEQCIRKQKGMADVPVIMFSTGNTYEKPGNGVPMFADSNQLVKKINSALNIAS